MTALVKVNVCPSTARRRGAVKQPWHMYPLGLLFGSVVVALVVTPEGFPLAYEVMNGNTADCTTLTDFVDKIQAQYGRAERIWVTVAFAWCLVLFAMMPLWHLKGGQNPSFNTFRTTPADFMKKVDTDIIGKGLNVKDSKVPNQLLNKINDATSGFGAGTRTATASSPVLSRARKRRQSSRRTSSASRPGPETADALCRRL